jgi:hypothetical protein
MILTSILKYGVFPLDQQVESATNKDIDNRRSLSKELNALGRAANRKKTIKLAIHIHFILS